MPLSVITLLFILIALIILAAIFSGSEIGMMSLNRYKLRHLVKKQDKKAMRVNQMLTHPEKLLSVILIGSTVANIIASMVATLIGQRLYGDIGVFGATICLTFIILVFAELLPKTLAALYPQRVAFATAAFLKWLQWILSPLVKGVSWITNTLLQLCGIAVHKIHKETLSYDELRSVVLETGNILQVEYQSMLLSLLDLERTTVEDIIIPKADIVGLDINLAWYKVLEQLSMTSYTRLPVYQDNIDHLLGIVHVRDILNLALEENLDKDSLLANVEEPYFIPEGTALHTQLINFQKIKKRSCFVVDEYGDLLGLVTMEDILEEVVGEYTTDITALNKEIISQADGSIIVDASQTLRHLNRLLSWQLPTIGPKTLSGLIIEYLGYIPTAACCLRIEKYQIEILKVGDNMIKTVKISAI